MDTTFPEYLGERNGGEVGGSGREENATIVFRSEARLKRSEPFLARRRSHRRSRRRRSRAAPWQPAEPAAADQIPVAKGRQSWVQLHQEVSVFSGSGRSWSTTGWLSLHRQCPAPRHPVRTRCPP